MLAHLLTIGAFDGRGIVARLHAQHVTRIFQRRPTLRLFSTTPLTAPTADGSGAAGCAALHHAQGRSNCVEDTLFGNHVQHRVRWDRAVGKRLNLNLQEHTDKSKQPKQTLRN